MDEGSMQARKRRRISLETELADRAGERAERARRRAADAEGSVRNAHLRAADAQEITVRAHVGAAQVQRQNLAIEQGSHGVESPRPAGRASH